MPNVSLLGSSIRFASLYEGREEIATSDFYTQNLTDFDRKAKTRTFVEVDEATYLSNSARFVRGWSDAEQTYLTDIAVKVDARMKELGLDICLPDEIILVKTTGEEEGGANGYTRRNGMYLNQGSLSESLFIHELFHIISRFNVALLPEVYAILGFKPCNEVVYDDPLRITNPDAPYLRYFLTVRTADCLHDVVMIMRASSPYIGGSFFGYYRKKLLVVEGPDHAKVPVLRDGGHVFLDHPDIFDLYDFIGRNTAYNIHQEEVSAVHFEMLLLGAPDGIEREPIERLGDVLRCAARDQKPPGSVK